MRKVIAILLVLALALSITACASTADPTTPSSDETTQTQDTPTTQTQDTPTTKYKIGFLHTNFTDSLGQNALRAVKKAADTLGVEVETFAYSGADDSLKAVENFISAGVDGILVCPASDAVLPKLADLCAANKVWIMSCFREVAEQDAIDLLAKNDWYLGTVHESEIDTAAVLAQILAKQGHTEVCMFTQAPGMVAVDQRLSSFKENAQKNGINILAEAYLDVSTAGNAAASIAPGYDLFLGSYPEATGVFMPATAAGMGEAAVASLKAHNAVGKVQFVAFDSFDGMDEAFDEGLCCGLATAHHADPFYAFMVLYNAMAGNRLTEEKVNLSLNYMVVTSAETCKELSEYVLNDKYDLYSSEEIMKFTKEGNPELTIEDIQEEMNQYTLENVVSRIKTREGIE